MSEYTVEAYYVEPATVAGAFGSRDQAVLRKVLADPEGLLAALSPRFSGKPLADAVGDLVAGEEQPGFPFHYSFATWAIVSAHNDGRPDEPRVGPPFVDLYALVEALDASGRYPKLAQVFRSLNNQAGNAFPHQLRQWAELPGFAYLGRDALAGAAEEGRRMRADLESEADWTAGLDAPEDIERVLDWIEQAERRGASLCLVMDGDL